MVSRPLPRPSRIEPHRAVFAAMVEHQDLWGGRRQTRPDHPLSLLRRSRAPQRS
jgi:hypothetical protein